MAAVRPDVTSVDDRRSRPARALAGTRLRLAVAAGVLSMVVGGLFVIGPAAIAPARRQPPVLPGLTLEDTRAPGGVVVTSVQDNSIADNAGVEVGDAIAAIGDQRVASIAEIGRYIGKRHPVVVELRIIRAAHPIEVVYAFPQKAKA
ncbi:MAG: PDZ domain-containing protein [Sandarakinorhabdus sp.]|nr:PDZ domain-containing protein [Sandarakinorhabdus sp.]